MEKITAYRISDGRVFEDKETAEAEQRGALFDKEVREFADGYLSRNEREVVDAITENASELFDILKRYMR